MSKIKLRQCPFCGSRRIEITDRSTQEIYHYCRCEECMARGPAGRSKDEAAFHWNGGRFKDDRD